MAKRLIAMLAALLLFVTAITPAFADLAWDRAQHPADAYWEGPMQAQNGVGDSPIMP